MLIALLMFIVYSFLEFWKYIISIKNGNNIFKKNAESKKRNKETKLHKRTKKEKDKIFEDKRAQKDKKILLFLILVIKEIKS